jgi:hypothetical protein
MKLAVADLSHDDFDSHGAVQEECRKAPPLGHLPLAEGAAFVPGVTFRGRFPISLERRSRLQDVNREGQQGKPLDLLLPGSFAVSRHLEMPKSIRPQRDIAIEEWAVDQGLCAVELTRRLPCGHDSTRRPWGSWFVAARKTLALMLTRPQGVQKERATCRRGHRRSIRQTLAFSPATDGRSGVAAFCRNRNP